MQTLHAQIEGSAKFAPNTPGRHVVAEVDNIVQLNAATYKVDYPVRFVILDDVVLVARRRRRRNAADNGKLVAERCWPLNDMLVLDTKDAPSELHHLFNEFNFNIE
jgi:exocyst complex component 8